jgi:NAD(P)H-hydrate epimerase
MELPAISPTANKYTRGSLLIIAGSARFPGAAVLSAQAAERTGAGYTTLAVPAAIAPIAQNHLLAVPVIAAAETDGCFAAHALVDILGQLKRIDAILVGPGMTVSATNAALLAMLFRQAGCPLIVDADALNLLSAKDAAGLPLWQSLPSDSILTPHSGELDRLLGATTAENPARLAELLQCVVVAKGPVTTVFSPKKDMTAFEYSDGTPALAKAGTGDVLAGIIASLVAQGLTPWQAAISGVELHGLAGRFAEVNGSRRSLSASDIICSLAIAFREIEGI